MIVTCEKCKQPFDDEFRGTGCPHRCFLANDGNNNFRFHPESVGPQAPYEWHVVYDIHVDGYRPVPCLVPISSKLSVLSRLTDEQVSKLYSLPGGFIPCAAQRDTFPTTADEEREILRYIDEYKAS